MILTQSLFNFGIFKNTIKRFKWGSLLYFIALFFSVPFAFLVDDLDRLIQRYYDLTIVSPILLRNDYMVVPLLLAMCVPTVVATLVFNNVHSSRQSVFIHGLPLNRGENYFSSIFASFVLMAAPVIANGVILMIMSFTTYGQIISTMSVVYWMLLNLSILFIMYSVATFTAFLTGNTAAHIVINLFVHIIPLLVAATIEIISDAFLFGFVQSDNFIASEIMDNTPFIWLFGRSLSHYKTSGFYMFKTVNMWCYIVGAGLIYGLGYYIYKLRKVETAGDVAAFKVFGPILKYAVTTATAVGIFAILYNMHISAFAIFIVAAVITAIIYFACEMIMNKSFKVFGSYKGYIGFAVFCAAFISFFAYTGVFGYEKRIPAAEEIESAAVYSGWRAEKPIVSDKTLIEDARAIHQMLIENITVTDDLDDETDKTSSLGISYKLKNGKWLERRYLVTEQSADEAMGKMYQNKEYKLKITGLDKINADNVKSLNLTASLNGQNSYVLSVSKNASEIIKAIEKDVEELAYREIEKSYKFLRLGIDFYCTGLENKSLKIFKEAESPDNTPNEDDMRRHLSFDITLNSNFKNTLRIIKDSGYYEEILNNLSDDILICKEPISRVGAIYTYKGDVGELEEFQTKAEDCVKISPRDARNIVEWMAQTNSGETFEEGTSYMVFTKQHNDSYVWLTRACVTFLEDNLPEYLKKYVTR